MSARTPVRNPVRVAITEVLEGQGGSIRKVAQGLFKRSQLEGHPLKKEQHVAANAQYGVNWFDIAFGPRVNDGSSPASVRGSYRTPIIAVSILVRRYVLSRVDDDRRDEEQDAFDDDLEDAAQALALSNNLLVTVNGTATNIVGGSMFGRDAHTPAVSALAPDWENHMLRATIDGFVRVTITQEV